MVASLKVISNHNNSLCLGYHSAITQNGQLKDGLVACELHHFLGKTSGSISRNTACFCRFSFSSHSTTGRLQKKDAMDQAQNKLLFLPNICLPHGEKKKLLGRWDDMETWRCWSRGLTVVDHDYKRTWSPFSLLTCQYFLFCTEGQEHLQLTTEAGSEPKSLAKNLSEM